MVRLAIAAGLLALAAPVLCDNKDLSKEFKDKILCDDTDLGSTANAKMCVDYLRKIKDNNCIVRGDGVSFCTAYKTTFVPVLLDVMAKTRNCGEWADAFEKIIDQCDNNGKVGGIIYLDDTLEGRISSK